MKVELKSNGTQHEIPSKVWEGMSRDQKSSYKVISSVDTVATEQTTSNKKEEVKKTEKPETGEKK
jgi:hypothetical protein